MRDILFVVDDRDLLDSVRARLYKHRHDWNMKFGYLAGLNAPFDWQGAQSRVANALRPT